MIAYAHGHPMPDGRRFEHQHTAPDQPGLRRAHAAAPLAAAHPELAQPASHAHPMGLVDSARRFEHVHAGADAWHAARTLGEAHPELAAVESAPAPGSPAWLRQRAAQLRAEARGLRARAGELDRQAAAMDERAAADERQPPDQAERLRRLFE